jgi:hypothetical protein
MDEFCKTEPDELKSRRKPIGLSKKAAGGKLSAQLQESLRFTTRHHLLT